MLNFRPISILTQISKYFKEAYFKKVFTIDNNLLLKKLDYYGIRGFTLDLFKLYISDRYQCIEFDGVLSDLKKVVVFHKFLF